MTERKLVQFATLSGNEEGGWTFEWAGCYRKGSRKITQGSIQAILSDLTSEGWILRAVDQRVFYLEFSKTKEEPKNDPESSCW